MDDYIKTFQQLRQDVHNKQFENERSLDSTIITVAGIGIALSGSLAQNTLPNANCPILMIISWIFLFISIVLLIVNMRKLSNYQKKQIESYDRHIESVQNDNSDINYKQIPRDKSIENFNTWAMVSLFIGLILMITFFSINILGANMQNDKKQVVKTQSPKEPVPPKNPRAESNRQPNNSNQQINTDSSKK